MAGNIDKERSPGIGYPRPRVERFMPPPQPYRIPSLKEYARKAQAELITGQWILDHFKKGMGILNAAEYVPGASGGQLEGAVLALAGSDGVILCSPKTYSVDDDYTIPANIHVIFAKGAICTVANTKTLTIDGTIEAGLYQIFSLVGTGEVAVGTGSVSEVYPQWWGAKADGVTNDRLAVQAAVDQGASSQKIGVHWTGLFNIEDAPIIVAAGGYLAWIGDGPRKTQIVQTTANVNLFEIGDASAHTQGGVYVGRMSVGTAEGTGFAFKLTLSHEGTYEDIEIPGAGGGAFYMDGCLLNTFKNVKPSDNIPALVIAGVADDPGDYGFRLETIAAPGGETTHSNANSFFGCVVEGANIIHGWHLDGAHGVLISGGGSEGAMTHGVYATNLYGLTIQNLHVELADVYLDDCYGSSIHGGYIDWVRLIGCAKIDLSGRILNFLIDEDCETCTADGVRYDSVVENLSDSSELLRIDGGNVPAKTFGTYGLLHTKYLIHNSSMESWVGGLPPPFWNLGAATVASNATKKSGDLSARITKTAINTYQGLAVTIPTSRWPVVGAYDGYEGQWICVEAYVRIITGGMLLIFSLDGNPGAYTFRSTGTLGVWQKLSASFFVPAGKQLDVIFVGEFAPDDDDFLLDDIRIWAESNPFPGLITFPDGDATPSVGHLGSDCVYMTGNTGPTTITTFDDGYVGQKIVVVFADNFTTVDFTNGLKGNTGVDWNPNWPDHMTCAKISSSWVCDVSNN